MEPGELGEPMQEKELLVLFREERSLFGFWSDWYLFWCPRALLRSLLQFGGLQLDV